MKSLSDLIAFNQKDPSRRAKYGQDLLEDANEVTEFDKAKVEAMVKTAQSRIDDLLRDEKLDASCSTTTKAYSCQPRRDTPS